MSNYLFLIELFAIGLYVVPKLIWNFFKYRTFNGALKVRVALFVMAVCKMGHLLGLLTDNVTGWWSFVSTAAFISMFIYSEIPHETKRRGPEVHKEN